MCKYNTLAYKILYIILLIYIYRAEFEFCVYIYYTLYANILINIYI